jgi:hypothetical protein
VFQLIIHLSRCVPRFFLTSSARRIGSVAIAGALLALLIACGGSGTKAPSGITNRVFVSNQTISTIGGISTGPGGALNIIDASRDRLSSQFQVSGVGATPGRIAVTPDKTKTVVADITLAGFTIVDNTKEVPVSTMLVASVPSDFVLMSDSNTGYAALRNANQVALFDISKAGVTTAITINLPTRVVLSHNGKKLLVFSDQSDSFNVIDTSANTATPISGSGLSRPVYGVFSSDDSKAYILSCGPECGGSSAPSVTVLDVATNTLGTSVPVSAATIGFLNNTSLYVAGTQFNSSSQTGTGLLDIVDVGSMTVSKSGIPVSDGYHNVIAMGSNNKLFIGATTCNEQSNGCLSIVDTSANTAVIEAPKGDVTGFQQIANRNVMYVCEGGELRVYDETMSKEIPDLIDIVGKAYDVKAVDKPTQ